MKRLLIVICALSLIFLCKESFAQAKVKAKENKSKMKDGNMKMKAKSMGGMDNMDYPYTANYSSDFKMGNPAQAKMILELWKDWDDNAFDRHDYMADTLVMFLSDGSVIRGKDSCLAGAMRYRGAMSSAVSELDAWIPLKSIDRNENWVAVWGSETDTWPDGKTDKREVHEIWRINKDGKVDFMKQFAAVPAPMQ
ncbi:MAG: hypothetical protein ABIN04_15375 [Ginsengibacter sp.]